MSLHGLRENRQRYYHMHSCKTATRNTSCIQQTTVTGFLLEKGTTSVLLSAANSNDVKWVKILAGRQHRGNIYGRSCMRKQGG